MDGFGQGVTGATSPSSPHTAWESVFQTLSGRAHRGLTVASTARVTEEHPGPLCLSRCPPSPGAAPAQAVGRGVFPTNKKDFWSAVRPDPAWRAAWCAGPELRPSGALSSSCRPQGSLLSVAHLLPHLPQGDPEGPRPTTGSPRWGGCNALLWCRQQARGEGGQGGRLRALPQPRPKLGPDSRVAPACTL